VCEFKVQAGMPANRTQDACAPIALPGDFVFINQLHHAFG
jgi:hypothetical protein